MGKIGDVLEFPLFVWVMLTIFSSSLSNFDYVFVDGTDSWKSALCPDLNQRLGNLSELYNSSSAELLVKDIPKKAHVVVLSNLIPIAKEELCALLSVFHIKVAVWCPAIVCRIFSLSIYC